MEKTAKNSFNGTKAACDKKLRKEILDAFNDKEYGLAEVTWKTDHAMLLQRLVAAMCEKVLVKHGLKLTGVSLVSKKDIRHYRDINADGILATEDVTGYTKVPLFGFHHLYFCSPSYGHRDYNKVRTCVLNGPLATDKNGNRYDPQAAWCDKILDLGKRIYFKKTGTNYAVPPGLPAPLIDSL